MQVVRPPPRFTGATSSHVGSTGHTWSGLGLGSGTVAWSFERVQRPGWGAPGPGLATAASTVVWDSVTEAIVTDTLGGVRGAVPLSQVHPLVATESDVFCGVTLGNRVVVYRREATRWAIHVSITNTASGEVVSAALATDGTTCAVVWTTNDVANNAVSACLFDAAGQIGSPFQVSLAGETYCQDPDVCFDEFGAPVFAYQANSPDSSLAQIQLARGTESGGTWAFTRRTVSGQLVGVTDGGYPSRYATVAANNGVVVVAYKYEGDKDYKLTIAAAAFVNPAVSGAATLDPADPSAPEVILMGEQADAAFDAGAPKAAHDPCLSVTGSGLFVLCVHRPDTAGSYRHIWYTASTDGVSWDSPQMIADTPPSGYEHTQFANVAMSPVGTELGVVVWECNDANVRTTGNMRIHGAVFDGSTPPQPVILSDGDAAAEDQVDRAVATYASYPFVYVGPDQDVHLTWIGADSQKTGASASLFYRRGTLA